MQLLQLITVNAVPDPALVYYILRVFFYLVSFVFGRMDSALSQVILANDVLEDWAVQELVGTPRLRCTALLLLASNYVTWTYQTHTFSNSVETLMVIWSLVLMQRMYKAKVPLPA